MVALLVHGVGELEAHPTNGLARERFCLRGVVVCRRVGLCPGRGPGQVNAADNSNDSAAIVARAITVVAARR